MNEEILRINNEVFIHLLETQNFKSNIVSAFILTDLKKETATMNALIPSVLKRGTSDCKTMKDIAIKMEEMYGAIFDVSIDKQGDQQVVELYISTIDSKFSLKGEDLLKESLKFIYDVMYNPYIENGKFSKAYVDQEKEALKEQIKSKINDKAVYATNRCIEEMFKKSSYSIYKYGREEDLENINEENLFNAYKDLLGSSEKHFYIAGNFDKEEVVSFFKEKFEVKDVENSKIIRTRKDNILVSEVIKVTENMDVTQGKLVLGYDVGVELTPENLYKVLTFNAILRFICKF